MQTTAQMYNISQVRLDKLCRELHVYPVPDYERFFTNTKGELYVISLNKSGNVTLEKLIPYNVNTHNGIQTYKIANSKDELEDITNLELCAITCFGNFPMKYLYSKDKYFKGNDSVMYQLNTIINNTEDLMTINGIMFKRVYVKGIYKSKYFVSRSGVILDSNRMRISPHTFQYNMYHRFCLYYIDEKFKERTFRSGLHRIIYNTWSDKRPWIAEAIQINHIDGFKYHNDISNLEEVTTLQNMRHAQKTGLRRAPYSEEFIRKVCELIESNEYDIKDMLPKLNIPKEKYGAIKCLVVSLVKHRGWNDITRDYDFTKYINNTHPREKAKVARKVCEEFVNSGYNLKATQRKFPEIPPTTVASYCRGFRFPDIAAEYGLPRKDIRRNALKKSTYKEIVKLLKEGCSIEDAAMRYGISIASVKNLYNKHVKYAK